MRDGYMNEIANRAYEASIPPVYRSAEVSDFSEGLRERISGILDGRNAIILGGNGVGKTRMAWAVAKELHRRGLNVQYVKAQILLFHIKRSDFPYRYCEDLGRCDCLIVDEIDKIFESKAEFIYLNYLVDYMSEWMRQIVFIGNGDRQGFIDSLGQSIFSRLKGNGGIEIQITGKDRRIS